MEAQVERRYKTPIIPGSFQGPEKVYLSAKNEGLNLSRQNISEGLEKENSYTLNRSVVRKFPRNRVLVEGFDTQWDSDTADLGLLSKSNDGYKYFLLMIDIFSRYVSVRPLKTKFAKEIIDAMKDIFKQGRQPRTLRTDGGKEFNNHQVKAYLNRKGVHHFSTHNEKQANYGERAIKTIKSKLYRYMVSSNSLRYIDVLQDIVQSYNHTPHRSLGRPPAEVNKENESEVRFDQYLRRPKKKEKHQRFKYNIGDKVRISFTREKFDREYDQKWSGEVFVVANRRRRVDIPIYTLNDWYGEPIKGTYYQQQLQKVNVSDQDLFKIEKILKRRRRNGKTQLFIRWLHWPRKYDSWINEEDVVE